MIPVCVVTKEWLDAQARANYDLAKAYMDGFEAGKKAALVTDGVVSDD